MCKINWELITQIISSFATLVLAAVAIWGDYLKAKFLKPSLRLKIYNDKGLLANGKNGRLIYYHLKLVNQKKLITVKNCKIVLKEIKKDTKNGTSKNSLLIESCFYFAPAFVMGFITNIDLNEKVVDFLSIEENKNVIIPRLNFIQSSIDLSVYPNEKTLYAIQIQGDNYKSQFQYFEINYTGGWDENLAVMKNYLKIIELVPEQLW